MEGQVLGGYRIIRRLDAGGMAEVYMARHKLMDRRAAVKILRPELGAREVMVARFFQEAQAAARIDHPGIVHVFDVGYTHNGRPYLIMEMLSGETLRQRLKQQGRLSLGAAITIMRQLAGVIAAAHRSGIIHRDLKPGNIFLVPDPEVPQGERIKVLDFGLAKLLEASMARSTALTSQGAVFGTPAYMSPEQCTSSTDVDERADLYSLGCIFYACLCGRPPFGKGGFEVLSAHLTRAPVPPRQRVPTLPPDVDRLVLALLEKEPAQRTPSCEALIASLDAISGRLPDAVPVLIEDEEDTEPTDDPGDPANDRPAPAPTTPVTARGEIATIRGMPSLAPARDARKANRASRRSSAALSMLRTLSMRIQKLGPLAMPGGSRGAAPQRAGDAHRGQGAVPGTTPSIGNGELGWSPHPARRRLLWALVALASLCALVVLGLLLGEDGTGATAPAPAAATPRTPPGGSAADAAPDAPLAPDAMSAPDAAPAPDAMPATGTARPERAGAEEAPRQDEQQLMREARDAYDAGDMARALARCSAAAQVAPTDGQIAAFCALTACKAGNQRAAHLYHRRLTNPQHRSWIIQSCLKQGIDLQQQRRPARPKRRHLDL